MKEITADTGLIAYCGLYCGACGKYLKGGCTGCAGNVKATWCKVRACCTGKGIKSCADCKDVKDLAECGKYDNVFSKLFGLIFRSDRKACVQMIRDRGYEGYAKEMAQRRAQTIKK